MTYNHYCFTLFWNIHRHFSTKMDMRQFKASCRGKAWLLRELLPLIVKHFLSIKNCLAHSLPLLFSSPSFRFLKNDQMILVFVPLRPSQFTFKVQIHRVYYGLGQAYIWCAILVLAQATFLIIKQHICKRVACFPK